jgi:serine protease Do
MHRRAARAASSTLAAAMVAGAAFVFLPAAPAGSATAPGDRLESVAEGARASVVTVLGVRNHASLKLDAAGRTRPTRSMATGFIYDAKGHVVTVASAVRDCDAILVRLADGREQKAMLRGLDEAADVALLEMPARDVAPLRRAPAGTRPEGTQVLALGPGTGPHARFTVGSVQRRYERPLGTLLLLSNEVYPGYSGGPAVDAEGRLLGLIVGRLEETPDDWADAPGDGMAASFALAADDLATLVSHLEQYGHVRRGFLGVRMVQGEVVDANRPDDPFRIGVRVEDVLPGSPAAQIDLRPGDLIVGWNGETLESPEDLMRRVEGSPPGTIVPLVWVRDEERHEGRLVVTARPEDDLLATPVGAAGRVDAERRERNREQLLERVNTLRRRPPGAASDTSRGRPGG